MSLRFDGNGPTSGATYDLGWILVAAVLGFVLFGLLGLGIFAGIAVVLTGVVDLGGG